jgi:pimeloyl-ACP methyl ester carboxylesterase
MSFMPHDRDTALAGGGSVAWREWGDADGDPVVFLHGTPGSRLFSPDTETSVRLVTLDRPGYGRSTPLEVPTLLGVAEIVGLIADDAGWKRFPVIGSSGGGPFALACGAFLGDRVSSVAAVSSGGPVDEIEAAYASLTDDEREMLAAGRADPAGATELLWEHGQWYADNPLRFLESDREPADEAIFRDDAFRSNFADANVEGARQGQAGLISDWVAEALPWGFQLADIEVPVDVWVGERDSGRAPLDAAEIARRIPSCTVHSYPDEGHWLLIPLWPEILERSLAHG